MIDSPTIARRPASSRRRGFTLIEVLVAVAIGLVSVLVMFRMISVWDTHTRSTTAGNDAQTAGALAMFALERDLKNAGLGIGTAEPQILGCTVNATDVPAGRTFSFGLYPIAIESAPTGGNKITVLYGDSSYFATEETFTESTATTKKLRRRNGFKQGDKAIVSAGVATGPCDVIEVTNNNLADGASIGHLQATYTSDYAISGPAVGSRFNPAGGTAGAYAAGKIFTLGPDPQVNVWMVSQSAPVLGRANLFDGAPAVPVGDGVVAMRAEYGVDANNDGQISTTPDEWTNTTPTDWTRVLAVRVALLVRSKQYERTADPSSTTPVAITPSPPTWWRGNFAMTNVDGTPDSFDAVTADPNNWRFYRYRVYQKVIPLRNMIWGTAP